MPYFISGNKNVDDFNNQTNGDMWLTTIWNIINTSNLFNRANSFLSYTRQRNCQRDLLSNLRESADKPSYMSGSKIVGDFNYETYFSTCLTIICYIINTSNLFNRANFLFNIYKATYLSVWPTLQSQPVSRDAVLYVRQYSLSWHIINHIIQINTSFICFISPFK